MIFFSDNRYRKWFVRLGGIAVVFMVVALIWKFVSAHPDPSPTCLDCRYTAYLNHRQPVKDIAITFDDGPLPVYTKDILDVLDKHHVKATFFVQGRNVIRYPQLLREIASRGHEIGNHTFTHAQDVQTSERKLAWELNTNNKLIESITGRSALLYRPPFLDDMDPYTVVPLSGEPVWSWVREHGYIPVGADLDSFDWQATTPQEVVEHVQSMLVQKETDLRGDNWHVVLFHESPQTAMALDEVLTFFEAKDYHVVPLTSVLGMTEAEAMPAAQHSLMSDTYVTALLLFAGPEDIFIITIMIITLLTFIRVLLFVGIKLIRREHLPSASIYTNVLTVAVLVPAYNEAENIEATLRSIIRNTRRPDEIIVINDGSTDHTEEHIRNVQKHYPALVRLISLENGGKARALNAAILQTSCDIVIAIDGDTVLDRNSIGEILKNFSDPSVGAVAGKILPATMNTTLEKLQYIEYIVGQNIEKTVIAMFGAVSVVPGAIGAWRRKIIQKAGGYSKETLVEDQDLTLAVLTLGYTVVYEPRAMAYTEVPVELKSFYLQRLRWTYGTFQCLWKYGIHLFSFSNPRLGWVALPYAVFYNVLLPTVTACLQIVILLGFVLRMTQPTVVFFAFYAFLQTFYVFIALRDEPSIRRKFIIFVPLQQFLYMIVYSGLIAVVVTKVLDGSRTRWNKLLRNGSAQQLFFAEMNEEVPATSSESLASRSAI